LLLTAYRSLLTLCGRGEVLFESLCIVSYTFVTMTRRACLLALVCTVTVFHPASGAASGDLREKFARAYALYSDGDLSQSKELFQQTTDSGFPLADYSLYYLAMIAFKDSNWDRSREYLSLLRERYPRSVWRRPAALQQAKIEMAEGNFSLAGENLRRLEADSSAHRAIADEALYLRARAQEALGELRAAHALYMELRHASPGSSWAQLARKEQSRLREEYPELFGFHTFQSLAEEAERLIRERQSRDAEAIYKKLLNNASEPRLRLRYLSRLSELYLSIRNRTAALPMLEEIAREFPKSAEAAKALYQIGQIHWNRHDNARALEYFESLLDKYPSSAHADRAQFAAADIHEFFGRKDRAIRLYTGVRKNFAASPVRDDAGWRLAWLHYRSGELPQAAAAFRELETQSRNGPFALPSIYWRARIAERLGDSETAVKLYRQIVGSGAESYYYGLSLGALERLGFSVEETNWHRPAAVNDLDPPPDEEAAFHLARARELAALSLHRLAVVELDELQRGSRAPQRVRSLLMREYFLNRAYGHSLRLAGQLPVGHPERERHRYPLAFWELVQEKSRERGLDPHLVLALIRQESLFDTRARSPAAAYGLMQLISPTARRVAHQLGVSAPAPENLFDPELNVTLGTEYLKNLLERYSNNWFKAIAAYNAGEAAVDRWEREITTDDIEEFVERIPYAETRGYVKLVMRNHLIYKRLYELQK
jgi:soluble lytic murein transglycosylase